MTPTASASPSSSALSPISTALARALVGIRFLAALALSLWIGGMGFFGIMAAPVLFHPERSGIARNADTAIMAPQMVSAMLTRFGTLTNICIPILVLCWIVDGLLSKSQRKRAWQVQGLLTGVCLILSQYLNGVLLPQTRAEQGKILPLIARVDRGETLSSAEQAQRATFDEGHKSYQRLASLNLYLLMAILLTLFSRSVEPHPKPSENGKLGRE